MKALFPPQGLIGWLRLIAIAEGISYLLFAITMPLKYGLDMHGPNYVVGAAHGGLFMLYLALAFFSALKYRWGFWRSIAAGAAAFIPIGTFIADKRIFAPTQEELEATTQAS